MKQKICMWSRCCFSSGSSLITKRGAAERAEKNTGHRVGILKQEECKHDFYNLFNFNSIFQAVGLFDCEASKALASIFPGFCWVGRASVTGAGASLGLASVVIVVTTGSEGATGGAGCACWTGAAPEKINFRPCNYLQNFFAAHQTHEPRSREKVVGLNQELGVFKALAALWQMNFQVLLFLFGNDSRDLWSLRPFRGLSGTIKGPQGTFKVHRWRPFGTFWPKDL